MGSKLTHPVTHEDLDIRLKAGEDRFTTIEEKLDKALLALTEVKSEVSQTKEIVEAWSAVKTLGRGIKWFSGTLTAVVAAWLVIKASFIAALK